MCACGPPQKQDRYTPRLSEIGDLQVGWAGARGVGRRCQAEEGGVIGGEVAAAVADACVGVVPTDAMLSERRENETKQKSGKINQKLEAFQRVTRSCVCLLLQKSPPIFF